MKWSAWVSSTIAITLFWLIALAPARLLVEPAARAGVLLGSTQGTIWSGSAKQLQLRQDTVQYSLANVRWTLAPADLFRAALCFTSSADVSAEVRSADYLAGKFCVQTNGTTSVTNLRAELPAATLFRSESIRIQGTVLLEVDNLVIGPDQTVRGFSAQGRWVGAGVAVVSDFQRSFLDLGDLAIRGQHLSPDRMEFSLSSDADSSEKEREGIATDFLAQVGLDGAWQVNGVLSPHAGMSAQTRDLLAVLAEPDKSGNFNIYWRDGGAKP